jgi:hypothetical protein
VRRRLLAATTATVAVTVALALRPSAAPQAGPPPPPPPPQAPTGTGDVTNLTPALRRSVDLAIAAARADGVELRVTSGWRSRDHQQRLFEAAVAKYGSASVARRWVLPPNESAHVRGEAVDVGPPEGAAWLESHGVRFGLCRRYANEPWHFERLAGAVGSSCPPMEPHA